VQFGLCTNGAETESIDYVIIFAYVSR